MVRGDDLRRKRTRSAVVSIEGRRERGKPHEAVAAREGGNSTANDTRSGWYVVRSLVVCRCNLREEWVMPLGCRLQASFSGYACPSQSTSSVTASSGAAQREWNCNGRRGDQPSQGGRGSSPSPTSFQKHSKAYNLSYSGDRLRGFESVSFAR